MATTLDVYSKHTKVNNLLRLPSAFTSSTKPTIEQVDDLIEQKTAEIDYELGTSFRLSQAKEYHTVDDAYIWMTGMRVFLNNTHIVTPLSSTASDSLKVFDGSDWTEWIGTYTEGRGNDFWIDERLGILHIRRLYWRPRYLGIDITYRYNNGARATISGALTSTAKTLYVSGADVDNFPYQGSITISGEEVTYNGKSSTAFTLVTRGTANTTADSHASGDSFYYVPKDIEEACTKLVAIDLLTSEDWSRGGSVTGEIPAGMMNVEAKIREWREDVDRIFNRRKPAFAALR